MAYMAGNLTRRFRSGHASSRKCPSSQTCVTEVVTSDVHEIVLDETKVGRLRGDTPRPPCPSLPRQVSNVGLKSNIASVAGVFKKACEGTETAKN